MNMETVCRICLAKCIEFKKFYEKIDLVSFSDMLHTLVTGVEFKTDDILCSNCCSELQLSYNFLIKVQTNNAIFFEQNYPCKIESIKDPLEEDSCDEFLKNDVLKYVKDHLPSIENVNSEKTESFEATSFLDDTNLTEGSSSSEKNDDELLLNNLSDLNVSPEHLIFPRGRFKCQICDKSYFTSAGLSAHHEVHLPKKPTAKKKRLRRQNKKGTSNETSDIEQNSLNLNGTNDISNDLEEETKKAGLERNDQPKSKTRKTKQVKPKKTFPCQVCGKEMISASKLSYHLVMHTGEKDFLCSMCPKAYSTIYALKYHFRSHSGYRPYECKFCGDRFYRPTTLKSHVRRHTGERPYGCDICGKRFIQHSSMTTHIKLNHMSKTIPCPHCDKKYARQTDLNTHLLSHTGDKPFSCQLCPSRFVRQANLNKHMKQQHFGCLAKQTKIHNTPYEPNIDLKKQFTADQIMPVNEN